MEDKKVAVVTQDSSPAAMIRMAVEGKADLVQLRELLSLQKEWESNEARKSYHKAMSEFKANPPKIGKDKKVSFNTNAGKTSYNHASLANVVEKISAELSKYGLSASWSTKQNGTISVTCRITHAQGHSEETTLTAPSDVSGSKNAIQAIGSTITYLERYTLLAITGLATEEMEDDGVAAGVPEYIDSKQLNQLIDTCAEINVSIPKFVDYLKIDSFEHLLKKDFQKAMAALEARRKQKAGVKK